MSMMASPQPFRDTKGMQPQRRSYETEIWDDQSNVVWHDFKYPDKVFTVSGSDVTLGSVKGGTFLPYLEIPCPVPTRLVCSWNMRFELAAAGRTHVSTQLVVGPYLSYTWPETSHIGATGDLIWHQGVDIFDIGLPVIGAPVPLTVGLGIIPIGLYVTNYAASVTMTIRHVTLQCRRGLRPPTRVGL